MALAPRIQLEGTVNPQPMSLFLVIILSHAATHAVKACFGILPVNHTTLCQNISIE